MVGVGDQRLCPIRRFDVTEEHVANTFGHQRNRITLAARELLQQRFIEYGGGNMNILDRAALKVRHASIVASYGK
ncbi:MAG: hypothetical protein ABR555_15665 [Pyrinomonadaceae bacterium]